MVELPGGECRKADPGRVFRSRTVILPKGCAHLSPHAALITGLTPRPVVQIPMNGMVMYLPHCPRGSAMAGIQRKDGTGLLRQADWMHAGSSEYFAECGNDTKTRFLVGVSTTSGRQRCRPDDKNGMWSKPRTSAIQRCILMTTDPGDLVFDPDLWFRHHRPCCRAMGPPLDHLRHLARGGCHRQASDL